MRLRGTPANVFSETKNQTIAVRDHEFALSVDSIFRAIDDVGAARAQLFRQCINSCYPEVDVRRAFRRTRFRLFYPITKTQQSRKARGLATLSFRSFVT
jgi:hypothetical protein